MVVVACPGDGVPWPLVVVEAVVVGICGAAGICSVGAAWLVVVVVVQVGVVWTVWLG